MITAKQQINELRETNPSISKKEVADKLNITQSTVYRNWDKPIDNKDKLITHLQSTISDLQGRIKELTTQLSSTAIKPAVDKIPVDTSIEEELKNQWERKQTFIPVANPIATNINNKWNKLSRLKVK